MKRFLLLLHLFLVQHALGLDESPNNRTGELHLTPATPQVFWPGANDVNKLSPLFSATITVTVDQTGTTAKGTYKLTSGPTVTTSSSDAHALWTPSTGGNGTYQITNTAADAAGASVKVSCIWTRTGGAGTGGSGGTNDTIVGYGQAGISMLDSAVDWTYQSSARAGDRDIVVIMADGLDNTCLLAQYKDTNGWPILAKATAVTASASIAQLRVSPAVGSLAAQVFIYASAVETGTSSVTLEYNDGSAESSSAPPLLEFTQIVITGAKDLWYIDSFEPPGWDTRTQPKGIMFYEAAEKFDWTIEAGGANFEINGPVANTSSILVHSIGEGGARNDCVIKAVGARFSNVYCFANFTVDTVTGLVHINTGNLVGGYYPDNLFPWRMEITYTATTRLGSQMPNSIPFNEVFSDYHHDPGIAVNNWTVPPDKQGTFDLHLVKDKIYPKLTSDVEPVPRTYDSTSSTKVDWYTGEWRIGTVEPGMGKLILRKTWVRYIARGAHE